MTEQASNHTPVIVTNDEIDLIAVFQIIWRGKWKVIGITTFAAVIAIGYSLLQTDIYQSKALLSPASDTAQPQMSQFQNLASMAGLNIGSSSINKTDIAIETLKSHRFIKKFVEDRNIAAPLMATKSWDQKTNTAVYDDNIYDPKQNKWVPKGKGKPSDLQIYNKFKSILEISKDPVTNFVTVSIDFPVPEMAQKWVEKYLP